MNLATAIGSIFKIHTVTTVGYSTLTYHPSGHVTSVKYIYYGTALLFLIFTVRDLRRRLQFPYLPYLQLQYPRLQYTPTVPFPLPYPLPYLQHIPPP